LHAQLSSARLEALKAQLHPHFLFNTLHTISELIYPDQQQLTRWWSGSLNSSGCPLIQRATRRRLRHELDILANYLELHRTRYGDRLAVTLDIKRRSTRRTTAAAPAAGRERARLVSTAERAGLGRVIASATGGRLTLAVADNGVDSRAASPKAWTGEHPAGCASCTATTTCSSCSPRRAAEQKRALKFR
jgi:hypothetical protein